ncbi:hypothetical protein ACIBKY_51355 [Nonomuraea sp. NPDC050394]|uniref:hypothetical protein n=1 Tax=Nonomuraea sp. NPDC050394 TaxID=3364363 RepID=UPI0037A97E02
MRFDLTTVHGAVQAIEHLATHYGSAVPLISANHPEGAGHTRINLLALTRDEDGGLILHVRGDFAETLLQGWVTCCADRPAPPVGASERLKSKNGMAAWTGASVQLHLPGTLLTPNEAVSLICDLQDAVEETYRSPE